MFGVLANFAIVLNQNHVKVGVYRFPQAFKDPPEFIYRWCPTGGVFLNGKPPESNVGAALYRYCGLGCGAYHQVT